MVDLFLVLVSPGGGDELQGLKRGIMELADLVVVNKADGELLATARATASDYAAALHLIRPRTRSWDPRVLTCSALTGVGVADVWAAVGEFSVALAEELPGLRAGQNRSWMWSEVTGSLLETLRDDTAVAGLAERLEREVAAGVLTPAAAARAVVEAFLDPHHA
jgi:LAO/AO transport system kinase